MAGSDDPRVASALRARLHRSMRAAVAPIPVAIPMLFIVTSRATDSTRLGIWCGIAMGCGLVQWLSYLRLPPEYDWTRRAVGTQVLAGSVWGLLPWFTMPETQVWQVLVGTTLLSVLAASALFAAPIRAAYLGFMLPAAVLGAASFAIQADGDARFMAVLIPPAVGFYLYLAEVTHKAAVESEVLALALEHQANTDALTGLANRAAFLRALDRAISTSIVKGDTVVAFLDLDDFKDINDAHGHAAGDHVLVAVARRLDSIMKPHEMVARIGGDEFTVVVRSDHQIDSEELGTRLLRAFKEAIVVANTPIHLSPSIGIAQASRGMSPTDLLGKADRAQYRVKHGGGNGIEVDQ